MTTGISRKSNFTNNWLGLNREVAPGFRRWLFKPGMAYGDPDKWWGDKSVRNNGHEGIDFVSYIDREGKERQLEAGIAIPPFFEGRIVKITDDFLGRTVVVEHEIDDNRGRILHTFHAHLIPAVSIEIGKLTPEKDGIGTIAPGNKNCPGHLHISTAWIAKGYPLENFSWADFREAEVFQPCDPLVFI